MIIDEKTGKITFSSGRHVYADDGIIGIRKKRGDDDTDNPCVVTGGYDAGIDPDGLIRLSNGEFSDLDNPRLKGDERKQLALYAISLWMQYGKIEIEDLISLIEENGGNEE